jgi:Leucine-rich repeat (LRR) protein
MNKDVLIIILSHLDQESIAQARLINHQFNRATTDEHLWHSLCEQDYPDLHNTLKQETFYETYKLCYGLEHLDCADFDTHYSPSIMQKYRIKSYVNKKSSFPSVICKLKKLEELTLSHLKNISEIPKQIYDLTNLKKLTLHNIDLQRLPDGIQKLVNLTHIDLSMNKLTEFPIDLCDIMRLTKIKLHINRIIDIPEELVQLVNLESLNLSWNMIKSLPKRIHTMINLKYIDLSHNRLTRIPEFICHSRNLNHISLKGNPIKVRVDL